MGNKTVYDFETIGRFVAWFNEYYEDEPAQQGWTISDSDSTAPDATYTSIGLLNGVPVHGRYWIVQRIDEPVEGHARLTGDRQARELAEDFGLMLDEAGVVIGWDGESFISENWWGHKGTRAAVSVKIGIGHIEYTQEDIEKEIQDLMFLRDAVLVLLNPEKCEQNWDIPFGKDETLKLLREMYLEQDTWSEEFIDEIFAGAGKPLEENA